MDRRHFIKTAATAVIGASLGARASLADNIGGMPYRTLGHTGQKVSLLGLGGAHLGGLGMWESTAVKIIRTAIDQGVNFLDNSWDYNSGRSEERMGAALRDGYRSKAFLMTKVDGRTAKAATQQLDGSLRRLGTDHVDLLQVHEVIRMTDPERVFAAGGAIEALVKAKQAGKLRYIGFTGHKSPDIHLHMLEVADRHGFVFDSVQMPLNVMDAHFNSFGRRVLPVLVKKNIGVLAMKSIGMGLILKSKTASAPECLRYTMSLPISVCITGCDSDKILQQALGVVRGFQPMGEAEKTSLLARTEEAARDGKYEIYKVTDNLDLTTKNPDYLG